MELLTTLTLSAAIMASHSEDRSDIRALRTLAVYNYRAYGIDRDIKKLERKYLPEEFKKYGGITAAVITAVSRQRVEFTWTF